jgi:hypothetical protein
MMIDQNNQANLESRLKETEEENELLLLQLHQVQEELEHYYLRNQDLEKGGAGGSRAGFAPSKGWVDDELPDVMAENRRLHVLTEVQRKVHQLEEKNALNATLGDLLIQGTNSPRALLALPIKLGKVWRMYHRKAPPESLGGKGFEKLIPAYSEGGFDAVAKLMGEISISPATQANGYTILGRYLMSSDRVKAAEAARRAHALDPKSYRLKWLAFRLHEAGDVIEAEAMLDILPPDIQFSDSESRQASRLRHEATNARQHEAKQQTGFSERRAEIERQLSRLEQERGEQSKLVTECSQEVEGLKQAKSRLTQERSTLKGQLDEAARQVVECREEVEALKGTGTQLVQEKSALKGQLDEAVRQVTEHNHEVEALKRVSLRLEQEKSALEERLGEATNRVEQERLVSIAKHEETAKMLASHSEEIDALKQSKAQMEREKLALAAMRNDAAEQLVKRGQEVEALKQAEARLEEERSALVRRCNDATQLAVGRLKQINELQQQIHIGQASKASLVVRQQLMQEEMVRAEAQLDLIKDVLLRESNL